MRKVHRGICIEQKRRLYRVHSSRLNSGNFHTDIFACELYIRIINYPKCGLHAVPYSNLVCCHKDAAFANLQRNLGDSHLLWTNVKSMFGVQQMNLTTQGL